MMRANTLAKSGWTGRTLMDSELTDDRLRVEGPAALLVQDPGVAAIAQPHDRSAHLTGGSLAGRRVGDLVNRSMKSAVRVPVCQVATADLEPGTQATQPRVELRSIVAGHHVKTAENFHQAPRLPQPRAGSSTARTRNRPPRSADPRRAGGLPVRR